jgi:peptide/nickel transport system permease protein
VARLAARLGARERPHRARLGRDGGTGIYLIDAIASGNPPTSGRALHAILPALTLGLLTAGIFLRLVRTNVIGTFNMPYIDAARSRGVRESLVRTHAYKPALIPIITVIGLQIALMLGGAVLTETTFEWKGSASSWPPTSPRATSSRCRASSR